MGNTIIKYGHWTRNYLKVNYVYEFQMTGVSKWIKLVIAFSNTKEDFVNSKSISFTVIKCDEFVVSKRILHFKYTDELLSQFLHVCNRNENTQCIIRINTANKSMLLTYFSPLQRTFLVIRTIIIISFYSSAYERKMRMVNYSVIYNNRPWNTSLNLNISCMQNIIIRFWEWKW